MLREEQGPLLSGSEDNTIISQTSGHLGEVGLRVKASDEKIILAEFMFPRASLTSCYSTLHETPYCPSIKLTYFCLSQFDGGTCLLKPKES